MPPATPQEIAAAGSFLNLKLHEYNAQNNVPALAATLVRDAGETVVAGQQGIRKIGASGPQNTVQATDKFNLGSISKVLSAHLVGAMIDLGTPKLSWSSTLHQIMPGLAFPQPVYKTVTIDQYSAHVSGMPYTPLTPSEDNDWKDATPFQMTPAGRIAKRMIYVTNALKDPLVTRCTTPAPGDPTCNPWGQHDHPKAGEMVCEPGLCMNYSGGQIINAAMLEHLTGVSFEDLMQEHIFGPLGMVNSRFGRASSGDDDGPWQHQWDGSTFTVKPRADTQLAANDASPRNPVGGMCCNALDLGRFLQESVRPNPTVWTVQTRQEMQSVMPSPNSGFTRGAWATSDPGSPNAELSYAGDNGSMYAEVHVYLPARTAVGAMCNMQDTFAGAAVGDMLNTGQAFIANWEALFGPAAPAPVACSHAQPALIAWPGNSATNLTVFARKASGHLIRRHSADGGAHWGPEASFGAWVMTSGLAATTSPDGVHQYIFGRGTDNQIWFGKSADSGASWQGSWAVPFGTFMTGPAVGVTANGQGLHLVAIGMDRHMYHVTSGDGGKAWSAVTTIGAGTFTSAPAITVSSDGSLVHVFGRGDDFRIWTNSSAGTGWQPHWAPIGQGVFTSGPGAAASTDGSRVHVICRGTDRAIWHNWTTGYAQPFQPHWANLTAGGTFNSAPALAMRGPGPELYVAALGGDYAIWNNHSLNEGGSWAGPTQLGPNPGLFI